MNKFEVLTKFKRINLAEEGEEGARIYQLLVSSEQQLLTVHPHPGSCFIPTKDQRIPADAKNANNPGLWRRKDCSEIAVVVHQQIFLLLDKKYFFCSVNQGWIGRGWSTSISTLEG